MADSPRPIWAWPGLGPRPGHALIFFCPARPGKKNCLALGPRVPALALGPRVPGPRNFFCLAWPGKKKLKHGLALAQGQARPKWVLGSRPRPGNKIYITYYILYIKKIITNQRKITTNQSPCPWRLATENFF